jgi:iron complex outermembrane recepter protein
MTSKRRAALAAKNSGEDDIMLRFALLSATALTAVTITPAIAQIAPSKAANAADESAQDAVPDIVVTATKREQTLQDIPISVAVASQDTIEKAQVRDLLDLQSLVPSLKVTQFQSAGQVNFTIRGFGNGNGNDGIESSVGVFIDGVYRSRSAAALDDLPEIERIEVLRGPQSTLFGKNVSAGAISIVTKKPQFDWGGKAEVSVGNFGLINPKATITGPLSESIAMRLSGSINAREGYTVNLTNNTRVNNRNRWSLRGDVLFEPSADFSVRLIGDYNVIKEVCCTASTVFNGPSTLLIGTIGRIGNPAQFFDRNVVYNTDPTNRVLGKGVSGQVDWNLGFAKLTSITGYRSQVNQTTLDADFTGADIVSLTSGNNSDFFTQELRLASTGKGPLSWLIGAFYGDEKLTTGRDVLYGRNTRAYLNGLTSNLVTALESLQALTNGVPGLPIIAPGQTYFGSGTGILDNWKQKDKSFSLFGQADFEVTDRLTITGGVGYLNDRKEVVSSVVLTDAFALLNLENVSRLGFVPTASFAATPTGQFFLGCLAQKGFVPGATLPVNLFGASLGASLPRAGGGPLFPGAPAAATCPASPAGVNPFGLNAAQFYYGDTANHAPVNFPNATESGKRTDSKVVYAARAAYDFGRVNAYVSYSKGWKGAAFNLSSDSRPANNGVGRTANPEDVTVYELGVKARFSGGFANLAVFKQTIDGFQSNQFNGLGFALVNAGSQSVKGVEFDATYAPVRPLVLSLSVTWLDPKYDSFKNAPCVNYDTVRCPINPATGRIPTFRDLTGTKGAGVPEWNVTASAAYTQEFGGGISGYIRGEYNYASRYQLTEQVPEICPDGTNCGTTIGNVVNGSIGIQSEDAGLEVMAWVRNLTKNNSYQSAFPTVIQTGSFSAYPNQPRTYGLTLRKVF